MSHSRMRQIKELSDFIDSKQVQFSNILGKMGWTAKSFENVNVQCSHNQHHWIDSSNVEKHEEKCKLIEEGYSEEELLREAPYSDFFYSKTTSVVPVHIDKTTLNNILNEAGEKEDLGRNLDSNKQTKDVPFTTNRYIAEFTPQQRLAVYRYVVEKSKSIKPEKKLTAEDLMLDFEKKMEDDEKPKTYLEILAEKRDYKRRRQSYRAKNVHITRKSYTEVMREVIDNQIQYLTVLRKEEEEEKKRKNKRSKSLNSEVKRDERRSRSTEKNSSDERKKKKSKKHRSHHKDRRSRSRSRHREHKKHKKHHR